MKKLTTLLGATALSASSAFAGTDLTYMMWGDPPEIAVWEQLVATYQETHPDVNISVEVADWDSYWEKLRVQTVGGDAPDIFAMDAPIYPDWQSRGTLLNLQPYLDADPSITGGLFEGPLSSYAIDGAYYGLPRDFQTIVMFYNKSMFDAAGISYPDENWTIDDLHKAAIDLTLDTDGDGKTDQWGIGTELWDMEPFWGPMVFNHGGEVISADFTHTLMTEGGARAAFAATNAMVDSGAIMSDEDLESYGYDGFLAGVAALTFSGHWVIPGYNDLEFDWAVSEFPSGPEGRATLVNSAGIVVSSQTEHPDEAAEFVAYVVSEEGQSILASLGFAIPVNKAAASGPAYLEQTSRGDHQLFLDALAYAHTKPSFRGYEEWSELVGEGLSMIWVDEMTVEEALDEVAATADDALGN